MYINVDVTIFNFILQSTVTEQYVTESRQSENQEARRDAAYRRYSTDGRPCMRQLSYDAERYQANIKCQTQHARKESYDEVCSIKIL